MDPKYKSDLPSVERLQQLLDEEAEAIRNIPIDEGYHEAVTLILKHVHQLGGKLVTSGMGKAGQIANNIATTFCSTGTPAIFLHPSEAQHGDLGILRENDLLLLLSNSGKTREVLELVDLARRLIPNIPYIFITGNTESSLAQKANVTLSTGCNSEICPLGLTPTTSTTIMTVIGDLLVVSTMSAIGFTRDEYAKRHHGGYLGHLCQQRNQR